MSTTTLASPAQRQRVSALRAELAEVRIDRAMAARMVPETTGEWLADLDREARDCWDHLVEALSTHQA